MTAPRATSEALHMAADMFDPVNWPAPKPIMEYGLYHYRCECPECGQDAWSDKGMLRPERAYKRHWWLRHENQNWSA